MLIRHILITASFSLVPSNSFLAPAPHHLACMPTTRAYPSPALNLFGSDEDDSPIPPELRDEIYAAESRTPTAQSRPQRILSYGLLTFVGVSIAFFNAFLTSLRFGDGAPSSDLSYYGFGWVESNFLTSFLFMNKIGGGLGLLSAGLFGTLAEVEIRSRKENAEKIWEEMQRRKATREISDGKKSKKKRSSIQQSSKKSMTGTQKKRLSALEELMEEENEATVAANMIDGEAKPTASTETEQPETTATEESSENKGIFSTIKNFYDKADSMAASQALLLNKELEDRGMIEKITDESGLKVIGKDAVAREQAEKEKNKESGN